MDDDGRWVESTVNNAVAVCVLNGLSELPDHVDLPAKVQRLAVVGEPQVESLVIRVVRKDEPAPELVLDDVLRSKDARMMQS